jgi:hypothetical protein
MDCFFDPYDPSLVNSEKAGDMRDVFGLQASSRDGAPAWQISERGMVLEEPEGRSADKDSGANVMWRAVRKRYICTQ